MKDLYAFMDAANSTLDESLEDEGVLTAPMSALSSMPGSVKPTPRGPPSAEASVHQPQYRGHSMEAWPGCGSAHLISLTFCCILLLQASMSSRSGSLQADPEAAQQAAEGARRNRLYSIMACIREVQKRNDRTGAGGRMMEGKRGRSDRFLKASLPVLMHVCAILPADMLRNADMSSH